MNTLESILPFFDSQIQMCNNLSQQSIDENMKRVHDESAKQFQHIKNVIMSVIVENNMKKNENNSPINKQEIKHNTLVLSKEDREGLPAELLEELKGVSRDIIENEIITIINSNEGYSTLDQLLVRIYKNTGKIYKRTSLTSKLHVMVKDGLIFSLLGNKGVYTTVPQEKSHSEPNNDSVKEVQENKEENVF